MVIFIAVCLSAIHWMDKPYRDARTLIDAIHSENVSQVQQLLESGIDPNQLTLPVSHWWSLLEMVPDRPLSEACGTGNLQIVEMLIDYGATAEYQEGTGWSPLREALFYCHSDEVAIVELLLEHGADPNIRESDDIPAFAAAEMIPKEFDKFKTNGTVFISNYDEKTAKSITEIVVLLLENQSVDIQTPSGKTLLMCAAESGNLYLAEYLITQGCDAAIEDNNGNTAYDYAVQRNHQNLIDLLEHVSE